MNVKCVQCIVYILDPIAKITAFINPAISDSEAKKLLVKEAYGNYTADNNLNYDTSTLNDIVNNSNYTKIGDLKFDPSYMVQDVEDFHIVDFHKLSGWKVK